MISNTKKTFSLKNISIWFSLIALLSCGLKVDHKTIDKLERYKTAKEKILHHFEDIKEAVNYQYYDSARHAHFSTITHSNRFYFENTICNDRENLKELLILWDDGLIHNENIFGTIQINRDSSIVFTSDYENGIFSGIGHYIVYDPTNKNGGLGKNGNKILAKKELEKHWTYIIEKKFYWDD